MATVSGFINSDSASSSTSRGGSIGVGSAAQSDTQAAEQLDAASLLTMIRVLERRVADLDEQTKDFKKMKDEVKDWPEKLNSTRVHFIESLAAFVAFFTFVSGDFQLFRSVKDWTSALSLVLLSGGLLLAFVLLIAYIMSQDGKRVTKKPGIIGGIERHKFAALFGLSASLMVMGILIIVLVQIFSINTDVQEPGSAKSTKIEVNTFSSSVSTSSQVILPLVASSTSL